MSGSFAAPAPLPDHVRVHPGPLSGSVRVPGDKSLSHRALLLGSLADGRVEVDGLAPSGDVSATASALASMGCDVQLASGAHGFVGSIDGNPGEPDDVIDCGNSGTTLRLLAGLLAGVEGLSVLTGDDSLRRRPVDRVAVPLARMGATVRARDVGRRPPLVIEGGHLTGMTYDSPVASAQVKSCLLLAGLRAEGPTTVRSPAPSRDHTERMLGYLGHAVHRTIEASGREIVRIEPGVPAPAPVVVPADPSSAAFWLVAGSLLGDGISLPGVCVNPTRTGALNILRRMGAVIDLHDEETRCGEPIADLVVRPADLTGATVGGAEVVDAIDELPVLAVAGLASADGLEVRDASELRVKESDRIATLGAALRNIGVEIELRDDGYRIPGRQRPTSGTVNAAGDHRIAMTAAMAAVIAEGPIDITGFGSVGSSYPTFLDDLVALGGRYEVVA